MKKEVHVDERLEKLVEYSMRSGQIDGKLYEEYVVNRGLRDSPTAALPLRNPPTFCCSASCLRRSSSKSLLKSWENFAACRIPLSGMW